MSKKTFLGFLKSLALGCTLLVLACGRPDPRTLPNLVAQDLLVDVSQDFATQKFKLCFSGLHEMVIWNDGPAAAGPFTVVLGFFDENKNLVTGVEFSAPNGLAAKKTMRLSPIGRCGSFPFSKFKTGQTYFPGFWVNRDQAVEERTYTDNVFLIDGVIFK
jgi:hypothetical protein